MKTILKTRSQNGRRGLDIVSASLDYTIVDEQAVRASLTKIGKIDGVEVIRAEKGSKEDGWMIFGQIEPVQGAVEVAYCDLQGNSWIRVLLLSSAAIVRHVGYKGRSSRVVAYDAGEEVDLTASEMLALGLIEGSSPEAVAVPQAAPISGSLAEAFARARAA